MSRFSLIKKFLVLLLIAVFSLNGIAATDPCKQGNGVAVMVFGGALTGSAERLKDSLKSLVSDPNGVTWQAIGEDAYGLTEKMQNILHDLEQEDATLRVAATRPDQFIKGELKIATQARDAILPFIGEFFANTTVAELDTQRAASPAYRLMAAELKAGKRVLLIGHADGAFVMQATYEALSREFGASNIGRYSIAPLVDSGTTYISAHEDLIVTAVRNQLGSAPVPNVNSSTAKGSLFGTNPVETYLNTASGLRTRIKTDISNALQALQPTASTADPLFIQLSMVSMSDKYLVELNVDSDIYYENSSRIIDPAKESSSSNNEIIKNFTCLTRDDLVPSSTHTIAVMARFDFGGGMDERMDPKGYGKLTALVNGHTQTIDVKPPLVFDEYLQKHVVSNDIDKTKVFPLTLKFTVPADSSQPVTVSNITPISPANISTTSRLNAKESEDAVGEYYNVVLNSQPQYKAQVSFWKQGIVNYGYPDSTRPDWLQDNTPNPNDKISPVDNPDRAVEVKNYDIQKNKRNLLKVIASQVVKRYAYLRGNAKQIVVLDLSGQPEAQANWSSQLLQNEINTAVATEAAKQNKTGANIDAIRYVGQLP